MLKMLLFAALLFGVYYIFFRKESLTPPPSSDNASDEMIPCAKCGTYVQLKETLTREGKHYCSRECLEG